MSVVQDCRSIEDVRSHIDRLDREIVALLAQRAGYVRQAAHFKKTTQEVKAPQRVEQVIAKVRAQSEELGANPIVAEKVYRAMIDAFITAEMAEHASIASQTNQP